MATIDCGTYTFSLYINAGHMFTIILLLIIVTRGRVCAGEIPRTDPPPPHGSLYLYTNVLIVYVLIITL